MRPEWKDRVRHWIHTLEKELYEPLEDIVFEGFTTFDMLDPAKAEEGAFVPMPVGTNWIFRRGQKPVNGKNFVLEPFEERLLRLCKNDKIR